LDRPGISFEYIFAAVVRKLAVRFLVHGCIALNMPTGSTFWAVACFTVTVGAFVTIRRSTSHGCWDVSRRSMWKQPRDKFSGMSGRNTHSVKFAKKQWLVFFPRRRSWWRQHPGLVDPSWSVWAWQKVDVPENLVLSRHLYFLEVAVVPSGME